MFFPSDQHLARGRPEQSEDELEDDTFPLAAAAGNNGGFPLRHGKIDLIKHHMPPVALAKGDADIDKTNCRLLRCTLMCVHNSTAVSR